MSVYKLSTTRDLSKLSRSSPKVRYCVVMEHIEIPTLSDILIKNGTFDPGFVAQVLSHVSEAASALYEAAGHQDGQPPLLVGPLRPGHVHHNPKKGRTMISPVHISHATLSSCEARCILTLADNELVSLPPERYVGERSCFATDEYYIALLGLELLLGKPPVEVNCYADLEKKLAFFDAPTAAFESIGRRRPRFFLFWQRCCSASRKIDGQTCQKLTER
jgi:hypothetical protein